MTYCVRCYSGFRCVKCFDRNVRIHWKKRDQSEQAEVVSSRNPDINVPAGSILHSVNNDQMSGPFNETMHRLQSSKPPFYLVFHLPHGPHDVSNNSPSFSRTPPRTSDLSIPQNSTRRTSAQSDYGLGTPII